jgi:hypothetical protein
LIVVIGQSDDFAQIQSGAYSGICGDER